MRYYEEMRTKFGFSDGTAVPNGITEVRELYIKAINHLAEQKGSAFRACAFDRWGWHNWCLILFAPYIAVTSDMDLTVDQPALYEAMVEAEFVDQEMTDAIADAWAEELDEYVWHEISVNFEEFEAHVYGQE